MEEEVKKRKTHRIDIRMTDDEYRMLCQLAYSRDKSKTDVVLESLRILDNLDRNKM